MGNNNNIIIIIRKRKRKRKEEIIVPSIPRFIEDSCLSQSKSIKRKQTASCPQPPSSLPRQHPTPDRDQPFTFLSLHIYMWIYKWVHVTETHLWYTCSLARFFFSSTTHHAHLSPVSNWRFAASFGHVCMAFRSRNVTLYLDNPFWRDL